MYYCVKENLCEVLFKSVSIQPLNIFEKGAGKIVYPPHHHLYPSRDCSTQNSLDVFLTRSTPRSSECECAEIKTKGKNMIGRFAIDIVSWLVCHCVRQTWTETVCTLVYLVVGAVVQYFSVTIYLNWKTERFTCNVTVAGLLLVVIVSFKY